MKLQYRAIEGTNTKTRRLGYLTAILLTLHESSLSEQLLLKRLLTWSRDHQTNLYDYYSHTGEITSTKQNSAGTHYLDIAAKSRLIVPLAGMYQITRIGSVLTALLKTYQLNDNPFFLTSVEKLFYTYCLLKADADILLTIIDCLLEEKDASLALLQQTFQNNFLQRLDNKISIVQDEILRQKMRDRKLKIEKEWKKPERYAEHIVPPRLNWLLDLGFLEDTSFRRHRFKFTEEGALFLAKLHCLGEFRLHDITNEWLDLQYWAIVAISLLRMETPIKWINVDKETQYNLLSKLLIDAFNIFHYTVVPKISLIQIMLYLSTRFALEYKIIASPSALTEWFFSAKIIDGRRYEIRLSPRENESYLIIM